MLAYNRKLKIQSIQQWLSPSMLKDIEAFSKAYGLTSPINEMFMEDLLARS